MSKFDGIVGADKLRARIAAMQAAQQQQPCEKPLGADKLCYSWKVPVTEEECAACHAGDSKLKMAIVLRSISGGINRHRLPRSCSFAGEIVGSTVQVCCGGKEQIIYRFVCGQNNLELFDTECYTCGYFKEKENAGS